MSRRKLKLHAGMDWHVSIFMLQAFKAGRWPLTTAYNRIKRSRNL